MSDRKICNWSSLEPVRYMLVGVVNTLVGLAVIYAAKYFLEAGDVIANVMGYGAGLTNSFLMNSRWTFGYGGPQLAAVARFLGAFIIAYFCNLATVLILTDVFAINSYLAQLSGIPPYTLCLYLLSKFAVFRQNEPAVRAAQN